ncbi:hypothetical protein NMY22_g17807 [Coprinellus aureogranulatus]|nr:hypothetical protein NMY22_g17807 [Coprinellus aureogranulatus]
MRVTVIVAIFFGLVVSLVGASPPRGLNARRMAQGLGPLPPVRRSPTRAVARVVPSGVTQCNTGTIQCCQQIMAAKEPIARWIAELAGVVIEDPNTVVGLACLPEPAGSYVWCICSAPHPTWVLIFPYGIAASAFSPSVARTTITVALPLIAHP